MPQTLTKDEELQELRDFIESHDGYVADLLTEAFDEIERLVRNDYVSGLGTTLHAMLLDVIETEKRLAALGKEIIAKQAEADHHVRRAANAKQQLERIKSEALTLSR